MLKISNLTCEFVKNPLGMDMPQPRLGWKIILDEFSKQNQNKSQSAYHILVASSIDLINEDCGDVWNSGKIISNESQHVIYEGAQLQSRKKYWWKVRIWDEERTGIPWSAISFWVMGIFQDDWNLKCKWIGAYPPVSWEERYPSWTKSNKRRKRKWGIFKDKNPLPDNEFAQAVYLRRDFKLRSNSPIRDAYLRISGLGYNEVFMNGAKVSSNKLDPGVTDYSKTVLYIIHDVKSHISKGENSIGVMLGGGWFWPGTADGFLCDLGEWVTSPRMVCELEIVFEDGNKQYLHSNESWSSTNQGPIRFNCVRGGEIYDARMELGDWTKFTPENSNKPWDRALVLEAPQGKLTSHKLPPIKVINTYKPIKKVQIRDNKTVYWFPKNIAGGIHLKIRGNSASTGNGKKILIELAERLKNDGSGTLNMKKNAGHTKGRIQTSEYICKGADIENWRTSFSYAGFQYAQISGIAPSDIIEIEAEHMTTSFKSNGSFACSDEILNDINTNARHTFLNGYHSYPEDCCHREKLGYTGDGHISANGSIYSYDTHTAYGKWLGDIMDAQFSVGQIPDIAPNASFYKDPIPKRDGDYSPYVEKEISFMCDPWWGGAIAFLPWKLYQHYGDLRILQDIFPSLKKYVDFLLRTTQIDADNFSYIISWPTLLGDWIEIGIEGESGGRATRSLPENTCTIAFYMIMELFIKIGQQVGKENVISPYQLHLKKIANAYHGRFYNNETEHYSKDSQAIPSMLLSANMFSMNQNSLIMKNLIENINNQNGHLTTGIVATYYLIKSLAEGGRADIAFDILTKKGYPGFEYTFHNRTKENPVPSHTLWENWQGDISLDHPVMGGVVSFFYEYLAGIQSDPNQPGFKHFYFRPQFISKVDWVKCSLETKYGTIKSEWSKNEETIDLYVEVPINCTAHLSIPSQTPPLALNSGIYNFNFKKV